MAMEATTFLAGRNPRHRGAVLSLYRALLRASKDLEQPSNSDDARYSHSLKRTIRRRFNKNKSLTSPRLLFATMAAGYKSWDILCKAKDSKSQEHKQVVEHLRRHLSVKIKSKTPKPLRPRLHSLIQPLLSRVSEPYELPRYTYNFDRPKSKIIGDRRPPILSSTAEGLPYIRLGKHQPKALSRSIGRKTNDYRKAIYSTVATDEDMENSLLEDEWENLVDAQREREGYFGDDNKLARQEASATFAMTVQINKLWHEFHLDRIWQDWTARGQALFKLVQEQRMLLAKEKDETFEQAQSKRPKSTSSGLITGSVSVEQGRQFPLLRQGLAALSTSTVSSDQKFSTDSSSWGEIVVANGRKLSQRTKYSSDEWHNMRQHLHRDQTIMTGRASN